MPKLPELTHRQLLQLLRHFGATVHNEDSPQLVGRTAQGQPFSIHCHPGHRARPETVGSILRDLGISREAFWDWYNGGRR